MMDAVRVNHEIDPMHPLRPSVTGLLEKKVIIHGVERRFLVYVPEDVRASTSGVYVLGGNGVTARQLFEESNWRQLADTDEYKEKFIVLFLEPANGTWNVIAPEDDLAYMHAVWMMAHQRDQFCIHEAKRYLVGYGAGGAMAQMTAMDEPALYAGVVSVGNVSIPKEYIAQKREERCVMLNGYEDPDGKYNYRKKEFAVPAWIISDTRMEETAETPAAKHWRDCARTAEQPHLLRPDTMEYLRTEPAPFGVNQEKEAFRVWISRIEGAEEEHGRLVNRRIYTEFLNRVRRWMSSPGGDLRMAFDPVRDLGMEYHYEEIDGWMREYYVYVPHAVKTAPEKPVPLVFAMHGYACSGEIYAGNSDWHKVADRAGFIVAFPTAVHGYLRFDDQDNPAVGAYDTELPAWNLLDLCPVAPDELKFFDEMLKRICASHAIDRSRVYATGHSLGSLMTQYLGLARPDVFAAIAPCSGVLFTNSLSVFRKKPAVLSRPDVKLPIWMFGGEKEEWLMEAVPTVENMTGQTINYWRELNHMPSNAAEDFETYRTDQGRWKDYVFAAEDVPMVRYTWVEEMPHATMTEMSFRIWEEFFSRISRTSSGTVQYHIGLDYNE